MKKRTILLSTFIFLAATLIFAKPVTAAIDTTRDCDSVAIITCGAMSTSELQADARQGDVPRVFANFGISQNELNGFVDGVVWKDGRVTLGTSGGGRLVATNAITAGRWNNPTSDMVRIPNTDRAYRMSTSHFVDDGQIAFIKMVNGRFSFAVIKTCGNPVTARPVEQPTPNLTITKDVTKVDRINWTQTVTVRPGEHVFYRIIIRNPSQTTAQQVAFSEVLPSGISQVVQGRTTFNGQVINKNLSNGMSMGNLKPGGQFVLTYEATTKADEKRPTACSTGLTNRAIVQAQGVPPKSDTAVVKVCAPSPAPTYSCDALGISTSDNRTVRINRFTTTARNGAVLSRVTLDWGDSKTETKTGNIVGTTHQYAADGSYTIRATAHFTVNGVMQTATAEACTQRVTFKQDQPPAVTTPVTPVSQPPQSLVDTGAGAIIGAVISTITGGTLAYHLVWLRRPY